MVLWFVHNFVLEIHVTYKKRNYKEHSFINLEGISF